jgi:hypothetical protein
MTMGNHLAFKQKLWAKSKQVVHADRYLARQAAVQGVWRREGSRIRAV